jgi:hypothetical protein
MKVIKKSQLESDSAGRMIMLYSETGCGKTTSILQSAPDPIAYIQTEPRALKPSLDAANRPKLKLEAFLYENAEDLIMSLATPDLFKKHTTIVIDSFSHLMNIGLAHEITDEAYDARSDADKKKKALASRTKMTVEGQGVRNQLMFRITNLLMKFAQAGKIVIVTALLSENPKWNRGLSAAPALAGKEYPTNAPGFFDLIGKLEDRYDSDSVKTFPPIVRFERPAGDEDAFVCKYTGVGEKRAGPLDITKILQLNGWKG